MLRLGGPTVLVAAGLAVAMLGDDKLFWLCLRTIDSLALTHVARAFGPMRVAITGMILLVIGIAASWRTPDA